MERLNKVALDKLSQSYTAYPVPKWIKFCYTMLKYNFEVYLYRAHTTVSKYVYVRNPRNMKQVKIRFSNHMPAITKELQQDCDFYTGVSNTGVITTEDIIPQVVARLR
jgi:hypothetical protein